MLEKIFLNKKHIFFNKPEIEDIKINMEKVDLYAIFNNFFLNSAWFLEKLQGKRREINIKILKKDTIEIYLENNGPILDNKYKDKILKNKAKAVVESSLSLYWYSFGLNDKQICCIKRIDKESLNIRKTCKLTVDDVYNKVKKICVLIYIKIN